MNPLIQQNASGAEAIRTLHERYLDGKEETFPAKVLDRLLKEENPAKVFRAWRGLALQQLATTCGASNSHISQIEYGKKSMSTDLLKKLAAALNVDAKLLL